MRPPTVTSRWNASGLHPPDLLFLDLNIPGTGGAEVLHAVKTDPATASMRVIVVTADR